MQKIAITGTFGAGKSTVRKILTDFNFPVFDCDRVAKSYYLKDSPIYTQLVDILNPYQLVDENGMIQLNQLSYIFFKKLSLKNKIESLIHKQLLNDIDQFYVINNIGFVEVPLLFELNWEKYFEHILVVTCDTDIALQRLKQKRNIDETTYYQRMHFQKDANYKIKRASYVIYNNSSEQMLKKEVQKWLTHIMKQH